MTTDTEAPVARDEIPPQARRTIFALIFGGIAAILDSTMVTIALHDLTQSLHTTTATIQWVTTIYLLAMAVAIPVTGWAQARFGGRATWMAALLLFVVASIACATAWNAGSLIAFRAIQGFGAGLIFPLMQTLAIQAVGTRVSMKARGAIVAAISLPLALGPIVGPILGGVILNWLSWRWMFLINVPLVAVGLVLAWRTLQRDRPEPAVRAAARLDVAGLALMAPALAGILLGLSNIAISGSVARLDVILPFLLGVGLLVAFVLWSRRRGARSLVDLTLLRFRSLASSSAVLFTAGAAMYAGMFLLPLYWQQLRGETVLVAALLLIPQGVGALVSRVIAARITPILGSRTVTIAAFVITAAATVPFAFAGASTSVWWLAAVLFVRGLGMGAVLIPPMMVAYVDLEPGQVPHASMITRISQQVGASFGIAIVAVVLQTLVSGGVVGGFQGAFWWTVGITLVAVIPALAFRRETVEA
ncbi:MAG: transporter [Microbacteriaceae bacterium]|nr:transporter [Microbacteriaceae bacterium]